MQNDLPNGIGGRRFRPAEPLASGPPLADLAKARPTRTGRAGRAGGVVVSALVHLAILFGLVLAIPKAAPMTDPGAITVALVPGPPVDGPPEQAAKAPPPPTPPTPPKPLKRHEVKRPVITTAAASKKDEEEEEDDSPKMMVGLSAGQLAGAATAGSGQPGRDCDMIQFLEAALRKDPDIQAAVASAHSRTPPGSKAILLWNGDWIRSPGQAGLGLAGVREAIMAEVAFAPHKCRADPVKGLVLISLNDSGSARVALGAGAWSWSDLLHAKGVRSAMATR